MSTDKTINAFKPFKQEEADKFAFYQIPKELTTNSRYKHISNDAKFLYGILRDRNQLSIKNNWIDDNGDVYIYFPREEAGEILNFASEKTGKIFKELKKVNLIQEKRQGLGKANIIYVGKIVAESIDNTQNSTNRKSGTPQIEFPDFRASKGSNTYINYTKENNQSINQGEQIITVKEQPQPKPQPKQKEIDGLTEQFNSVIEKAELEIFINEQVLSDTLYDLFYNGLKSNKVSVQRIRQKLKHITPDILQRASVLFDYKLQEQEINNRIEYLKNVIWTCMVEDGLNEKIE